MGRGVKEREEGRFGWKGGGGDDEDEGEKKQHPDSPAELRGSRLAVGEERMEGAMREVWKMKGSEGSKRMQMSQ